MIRDLRQAPAQSELTTDVCIVGAGAAGITLALALDQAGVASVVLESGGMQSDPADRALNDADNSGIDYSPVSSRLRQFGGTTGHWAGYCRPFERQDFERRAWVPGSGWPIDADQLAAYLPGAHDVLQLGRVDYDPTSWLAETQGVEAIPDSSGLTTDLLQFSPPVRFAETYRPVLETKPEIDVVLHANAVSVTTDEGGRVIEELVARDLDGAELTVRARRYVLAAGGIENPRLLLALANRDRGGLGNANDNVGRYFCDHLGVAQVASLVTSGPGLGLWVDRHPTTTTRRGFGIDPDPSPLDVGFRLRPSNAVLEELEIAGLSMSVAPTPDDRIDRDDLLLRQFAQLVDRRRDRPTPAGVTPVYDAGIVLAVSPNRASRVTLTSEVDALDLPVADLDWTLNELDQRTLDAGVAWLAGALSGLGVGRGRQRHLETVEAIAADALRTVGNHHMGTTRMSADPVDGVVDPDCLVHGMANLYVAGSSVFTTSGISTPTLNLVALTLRLADHLAGRPYATPTPGII